MFSEPFGFGFLQLEAEISFSQGYIRPISEFAAHAKLVLNAVDEDGFLYPPTEQLIQFGIEPVPVTITRKRPAHLFQLPPSHELALTQPNKTIDPRETPGTFLLCLLSVLFETRLHFSDWFIDGRIPFHPDRRPIIASYPKVLGEHLSIALEKREGWNEAERLRFQNILYLFSRVEVYQWDWERFLVQYMILDSCWMMGKVLLNFKAKNHTDRAKELYGHFGLYHPILDDLRDLSGVRNELFHEGAWHGGRPGHVGLFQLGGYDYGIALSALNEGVIRRLLDIV